MANTDPFEVSKALRPFARTIKVTEAAVARGRTGAIQRGYRPRTWAMNGKRTSITTDGAKENIRYVVGGGPTKAGGAVAAGVTATGAVAAKKKLKKNMSDPFEINKAEKGPFRRQNFQNTRRENTKVAATIGAGMYGSAGAGIGAGIGVHEAKRGIRALDSVGAHPGKLRAAKLVAGHAGKGGAALGVLGAAGGAAVGSVVGATAGSKGSKLGELQRKQAIAGSKNRAARLDRKAAKARSRAQEFSKSAFGVEHAEIHKGMLRALKVGITSERLANAKGVSSIAGKDLTSAIKHNGSYQLGMKIGNKLPPKKIKKAFDTESTRPTQLDVNAGVASIANAKSAFGVEHDINKADRRMGGQAEWSGHLPKHTPGAVSAALAGQAKPALPPKAAAIRAGLKPVKMAARLK